MLKLAPVQPIRTVLIDSTTMPESPEIELQDLGADVYEEKYPDGKIKIEAKIKNGMKHGYYIEYFQNGTKKVRGEYENDKRSGTWRYYDEYGTVLRKKEFENGIEIKD
jgi:antitoxin component YwqK of YwqJK toxin-antitoxin module